VTDRPNGFEPRASLRLDRDRPWEPKNARRSFPPPAESHRVQTSGVQQEGIFAMIYEKGDRVVAAQRIGGIVNPSIRKGTRGVVTAVAFYADEVIVTVAFSNGRIKTMSPDQITAADHDPSR